MKTYITSEALAEHMKSALDIFCKKNAAYGNSFEQTLNKFGLVAANVRISDKLERLITLTERPDLDQFDESLIDTATDLGNYAYMLAVYLKGVKADEAASKSCCNPAHESAYRAD